MRFFLRLLSGVSLLCLWFPAMPHAQSDSLFPCPANLVNNVRFWEKIYSEYSVKQAVLHDIDQILNIYDIVSITPNDPKRNRGVYEAKRNQYSEILDRIAQSDLSTEDAKRVWQICGPGLDAEDYLKAKETMRFQSGQKEKFLEGLQRSGRYIDRIRKIFFDYGLPERLIYLPHVESSFNYRAYSFRGAAGMWQFMRSTGRLFLRIDYLVDERLDPIASSVAAAKFLKRNHERLKTWPLAITAYNHGANGMERAVENLGTSDLGRIIAEHTSASFKFASKNFYSEFLAASNIAMNHEKYFGKVTFEAPLEYKTVVLDRYYAPETICKTLGISVAALEDYNPALRPAVFRGARKIPKGVAIKIPAATRPDAEAVLASVPAKTAPDTEQPPQYYTVERGDRLSLIAKKFSVPVERLVEANNLDNRSRIAAGQILTIPAGAGPAKPASAPAVATTAPAKPETAAVAAAAPVPAPAPATPPVSKSTKVVKEAVEPAKDQVAMETPVEPEPVPPALTMDVPKYYPAVDRTKGRPSGGALSSDLAKAIFIPAEPPQANSPVFNEEIYALDIKFDDRSKDGSLRVGLDETLSHFADWLLIPYKTILKTNGLSARKTRISIGQELHVSFRKRSIEDFKRIRLEYHMAIEEDFYAAFRVKGTTKYQIKRGDSMWDLSDAFNGLPLWLIKKYNPDLNLASLSPGQEVQIPEIEELPKPVK